MTNKATILLTCVWLIHWILATSSVYANEPMSAIDWLAEKINDPPDFVTFPNEHTQEIQNSENEIRIDNLPGVSKNSIGIFGGIRLGLPFDIWSNETETVIANKIGEIPSTNLFRFNRFFKRVLLVEADPPITENQSEYAGIAFLRARLLKLISMGALDDAEALIESANPSLDPNLLDIWAKISFLTRRLEGFCGMILESHNSEIFPPHRVICLARSGDWNAAALALATYSSIGEIDKSLEHLLINYLDHEAGLEVGREGLCSQESAILVYLCGFSGILISESKLPLEFLYPNLSRSKSIRARINASEEFAKSGALNPSILFSNYKIKQPSTSGGVWARAKLIQELDMKFNDPQSEELALLRNLSLVVTEFTENHLLTQFAETYGKRFQELNPNQDFPEYYNMVLALVLLSGEGLNYRREEGTNNSKINTAIYLATENIGWKGDKKVDEIYLQNLNFIEADQTSLLDRAVLEASFGKFPVGRTSTDEILLALSEHRIGFVLLKALALIASGENSDLLDLQTGLASLVRLGLLEEFKTIATEILIMDYFLHSRGSY